MYNLHTFLGREVTHFFSGPRPPSSTGTLPLFQYNIFDASLLIVAVNLITLIQ